MVGAKVRRRRTLTKYLDAVNFPGGNPTADPTQEMAPELWYIEQKSSETNVQVDFMLASALDFGGQQLPARQITGLCSFKYRGPECGYVGIAYFDKNDQPVSDPALDRCSFKTSGCECRFGVNNPLPWGGFLSDTLS
jgi:lambda family phage minor tail protein L